jgi:HEPN domain-containing protein
MNPLTQEWINKAEGDFRTATREIQVTQDPSYDGVCFHAQQCVEKYLKGNLQAAGIAFPKTHDLVVLLDLSLPIAPQLDGFRSRLRLLSLAAVEIRYPGRSADQAMAEEFYQLCIEMRDAVRSALGVGNP